MNEKTIQLFMRATASVVCGNTDCEHCHEIYGTGECPEDIDIKGEEVVEFISKMVQLLRQLDEDMPFTADITDDELVSLLKDAVTAEE